MSNRTFGFATALAVALAGTPVRRSGWRNKFSIQVESDEYTVPVLLRVHDDGSFRAPWGVVTEDDLFATDWEADGENVEIPAELTGTPAAIDALIGGGTIRNAKLPPMMTLSTGSLTATVGGDVYDLGKAVFLTLPNGKRVLYRFAPQDLIADYEIC